MRLKKYSLIGLGALLLAACSTSPVVGPVSTQGRETEAEAAFERGDFATAQEIYSSLAARTQGAERARFQIALAESEVKLGRPEAALAVLDSMTPPIPAGLDPDIAAARASAFFALGRTADAVRLLVEREIWLDSGSAILDNHARIWDGLSNPLSQAGANLRTGDATIDGWLALAPLTRFTDDSERFLNALLEWREEFGNHPAAGGILAERLAEQRGAGIRPTTIALLLPLSSNVRASAEAIQEGFFSAASGSSPADRPAIRIYDTAQRGSVESFMTAQLEGADFIVGPLLSEEVAQVQAQAGFIPTLALNLGASASVAATNFFQFALAYDDEVDAIAARGIADGHRTAAILYASNDRGYNQRDRFREAWESRGGTVVNAVYYVPGGNLSAPIEELLNIDQSEARHERLVANLGRSIEFEPRRRTDIDMIFLQVEPASGNATARLLVPLLRENNADPDVIPTFATRDVYDPTRRNGDPDLNGLIFPDVPLLIDPRGAAQEAASRLAEFSTAAADQNRRFFAFGFDAFRLAEALYTRGNAGWPLPGATGNLYLGDNGRIRRTLPFAQFSGGQPQPLPPSADLAPISGLPRSSGLPEDRGLSENSRFPAPR
jgi:hypothetical protein